MAEKDFNDVLDDIVLTEEKELQISYEEGYHSGIDGGNPEGYHLGYHRGAELGREIGYYFGIVTHYINHNEKSDVKYPEKVINQLIKVKELVDTFPRTNAEDQDLLGLLETVRAQYKKACALLKIPSSNPYDAGVSF